MAAGPNGRRRTRRWRESLTGPLLDEPWTLDVPVLLPVGRVALDGAGRAWWRSADGDAPPCPSPARRTAFCRGTDLTRTAAIGPATASRSWRRRRPGGGSAPMAEAIYDALGPVLTRWTMGAPRRHPSRRLGRRDRHRAGRGRAAAARLVGTVSRAWRSRRNRTGHCARFPTCRRCRCRRCRRPCAR